MTEYVITYQLPPEMLSRAMMFWAKPLRKRRQKWQRFGMGFAPCLILVASIVVLLQFDLLSITMLISGAAGCIVTFELWSFFHRFDVRELAAAANASLERHGPVRATFCPDPATIDSKLGTGWMNWLCFDGIDRITDATILRTGGLVYAAPYAALPDDVTPEAFRADLTTWMEAAR